MFRARIADQRNGRPSMASAGHLKALLKSHVDGDDDRFYSVAMQVAAHEARLGHGKLAQELRAMIDDAKGRRDASAPVPISRPRGELANILEVSYPKARLSDMILGRTLSGQIKRVIREQRNAGKILEHGLSPRRKLLLVGPPGTGKTLTASVLSGELGLPLFSVRLDGLITKFMGETAAKLRQVFDATSRTRGIYFFDEFDAIGSLRSLASDVGEIRRVLNSFLLMIEQDRSQSLVVAATNHPKILDPALFRRFDDVLNYDPPDQAQIADLLRAHLADSVVKRVRWKILAKAAEGLNYNEVTRAANEVLKYALISNRLEIDEADILTMLEERIAIADRLSGGHR